MNHETKYIIKTGGGGGVWQRPYARRNKYKFGKMYKNTILEVQ